MKRILICAAAAIVALASCSKTQVVYNGAPEEIGFKAVTGVMTKTVDEWDSSTEVMGVFANPNEETALHLNNAQFKKDGAQNYFVGWSGSAHKPYYWPLGKNLDFVAYAPYKNGVTYDASTSKLTISVDNTSAYTDILYGAEKLVNKSKQVNAYSLNMSHALAWIQVNVVADQDDVLKITSFDLTGIVKSATLIVDYTTPATPSLSWTNKSTAASVSLLTGSVGTAGSTVDILVIPAAEQTAFAMEYALGSNENLTWNKDLEGSWVAGYKYIYNISVGASEIKITPAVTVWDKDVNNNDTDDDTIDLEINQGV